MEWIEAVKEIKKAQGNNRLVIFVGAGVSKNSGLPTWKELIDDIAKKIHYKHCEVCDNMNDWCDESECTEKSQYTQDEYLRIPEYFYQQKSLENRSEYYDFLKKELSCDNEPNLIDNEVFNVFPHHIITTNYDSLLEDSSSVNSSFYQVVTEDADLIRKASDRYLIKMHGDLDAPDTMVLKESDYIEYEQTHPLISLFIRSLLVNHTFLFIGYSLNDSNLNLIIGWINYFRHYYGIKDNQKHFLITTNESSSFEKLRLKDKNIYPISLSSFPKVLSMGNSNSNPYMTEDGEKLWIFLKCITDIKTFQKYAPTEKIIADYQYLLDSYKQISFEDFLNVYQLEATVSGTILYLNDEQYKQIIPLLDNNCIELGIKKDLIRTIITEIKSKDDQYLLNEKIYDDYFQLYLDNDYTELRNSLMSCTDIPTKIYYYKFLQRGQKEINQLLDEEASYNPEDSIDVLMYKMRVRLATITITNRQGDKSRELRQLFDCIPNRYQSAIGYIRKLFVGDSKNESEMQKILERQQKKYFPESNTIYSEDCFKCIWDIQSYAYDYYFFFKSNKLPLDDFQDPKEYLQYYIEAILCSYYPQPVSVGDNKFFLQEELKPYPINEIDFDIFIKYIEPKNLNKLIDQYHVKLIQTTRNFNIEKKYINLCNSFYEHPIERCIDQIYNFNILMCYMDLDNDSKKDMFSIFIDVIKKMVKDMPGVVYQLFDSIYNVVINLTIIDADKSYRDLLNILILPTVYPNLIKYKAQAYAKIIKELKHYKTNEIQKQIIINLYYEETIQGKVNEIFELRHILPMRYYVKFLGNHLEKLGIGQIFNLLIEGSLDYSEQIEKLFIDSIDNENTRRAQNSYVKTFPDKLSDDINMYIILRLCGFKCDLSKLQSYIGEFSYLGFLLDPENFDYSLVDTTDYMWQNIMLTNEYKSYFIRHRNDMHYGKFRESFDELARTENDNREGMIYAMLLLNEE